MKEFTEDTSHEIQTPLAIIKAKAEILLQSKNLGESQLHEINQIFKSVNRLSKLRNGLLLLTRIENNQYDLNTSINLKDSLHDLVSDFKEILEIKGIKVQEDFKATPVLIINQDLSFILLNNLLSNAIKHNFEGGIINIKLNQSEVIVANTGPEHNLDSTNLFNRLAKGNPNSNSSGLGLAIVKKICDLYKFKISYKYINNLHLLNIQF